MIKFICELCNGTIFTKVNSYFVCDCCQTKYSIEEMKKNVKKNDEVNSQQLIETVEEKKLTKEEILCQLNIWYDFVKLFNELAIYFDTKANDVLSYKEYLISDSIIPTSYNSYKEQSKSNFLKEFLANFKKTYIKEDKLKNGYAYQFFEKIQKMNDGGNKPYLTEDLEQNECAEALLYIERQII